MMKFFLLLIILFFYIGLMTPNVVKRSATVTPHTTLTVVDHPDYEVIHD